jgi:YebC/PmpR family DNA-binding regulatory protein
MSGHSKWSTIKRKKGAADAKRGKIFTKIAREIMVAARAGGGDPSGNPALRLALSNARAANMPKDNQERAIKKGLGELDGAALEEVLYEGRGPSNTAFLVEVMTDNRNRTIVEVRHQFAKVGGELGSSGSVAWMFERRGVVTIDRDTIEEDPLTERAVELGADDVRDAGEAWIVLCDPGALSEVQGGLDDLDPSSAGLQWLVKPESGVSLEGEDAIAVAQLWARLDELDDVQNVYCSADLPSDVMEEHGP